MEESFESPACSAAGSFLFENTSVESCSSKYKKKAAKKEAHKIMKVHLTFFNGIIYNFRTIKSP